MEGPEFQREKHIKYFLYHLNVLPNPYTSLDTSRMTAVFFCVSGLDVLGALDAIPDKKKIIDWIYSLQITSQNDPEMKHSGFRGSPFLGRRTDHPEEKIPFDFANSAMTYTALSVLVILGDDLSRIDRKATIQSLKHLQQEDGSFGGVFEGSESDMRFVFTACVASYILNDWSGVDIPKALEYIRESQNYDFGIGQGPSQESHGGSTYCAVAALALMGKLDEGLKSREKTLRWCLMRQITGFQGRPSKDVDTCYSFWVGASIHILGGFHLINEELNRLYILGCQSAKTGGIAKAADIHADVLHTYMGICGLSLLGEKGLSPLNPSLNITQRAAESLKRTVFWS